MAPSAGAGAGAGGASAKEQKKVVVVGGGLVGALAAVAIARLGFHVQLVERRSNLVEQNDMEANGQDRSVAKRSINLALSKRGQEALARVGLLTTAMTMCVPMYGRAIHVDGKAMFQRYDETDESNYINSISREQLNLLLLRTAQREPNVEVLYGLQLQNIDRSGVLHFGRAGEGPGSGTFNDCTAGEVQIADANLVLGCDGAYSSVREAMLRLQTTDFSRRYFTHGYKELEIPPSADASDYQLRPPHALHIWPRGDFMMIALPNPNRSFTCTIFAPMDELDSVREDDEIMEYFERNFPDAIPVIPDLVEQFKRNPACRLVMSQVNPWNLADRVVVLGDAAHACVPFYGQGMNCGMEDALELCETIESCGFDLGQAVPLFARTRMPRGNAIVDLSLRNYVEMRAHTASRLFLLRKRVEGWLNWLLPDVWVPLYKMVAFTRIPYDEAIRREALQERALTAVTALVLGSGLVSLGALALAVCPRATAFSVRAR